MQVHCNIMTKILDTNNTIYIFFFIMLLLLWWGIRKVNIFVYLIFIKTRLFGDNCQRWQLKNETRRSTPSVLSWILRQERCLHVCTRWAYHYRWIIWFPAKPNTRNRKEGFVYKKKILRCNRSSRFVFHKYGIESTSITL